MAKWSVRVMDTDNGGIEWGEPSIVEADVPERGENESQDAHVLKAAQVISRAQYALVAGPLEEDEGPPGELAHAAGDVSHGIAWIEDRGHQGATSIIIEWHEAA